MDFSILRRSKFKDLAAIYRSAEMFPFLKNRVLSPKRDDFETYRLQLDLGANPHPLDQLKRSSGRRATDNLEVFTAPEIENGRAQFSFFLRGVRHLAPAATMEWRQNVVVIGRLRLLHEPGNSWDRNALLITSERLLPLGFVPRYYSAAIREYLEQGDVQVQLLRHNPAPAPDGLRFRVALSVGVQDGWSFSVGEYELLSTSISSRPCWTCLSGKRV